MDEPCAGLNVHVYPSPFQFEIRILKVTNTLVSRSIVDRVLIVATGQADLPERETIDDKREIRRFNLRLNEVPRWLRALRFAEFTLKAGVGLRREEIEMVNCHSLSVLPLCVVLKWWHKARLIYEPHEIETETAKCTGTRQVLSKWVERSLIGQAEHVITVSESIATRYREDYGLPAAPTILNVPQITSDGDEPVPRDILRARLGIPDDDLIFVYQGVLNEGRGALSLLNAFRKVPADRHLVLMGFGDAEQECREAAASTPNIHLHPTVPAGEVMRYARGADVGLVLLRDTCLNHRYALPNKLFQYLHADLPVLVSDLGELGGLVQRYECGWRVPWGDDALANCVSTIERSAIAKYKAAAIRAKRDFHWDLEAEKLESIYRDVFSVERSAFGQSRM